MEPDEPIELPEPIIRPSGEAVFPGYGPSHISYVPDYGYHVTTQIPGIPDGCSIHDDVDDMNP